jgi:20S proteasome alpha/beta subunit
MDFLIGFTGKGYAILAADANAARSIMVYSQALDKIRVLDSHKLLAVAGDAADCIQEPEYIQKNLTLYAMRNGVQLTTHATANYIRNEKSHNLRRAMSQVR